MNIRRILIAIPAALLLITANIKEVKAQSNWGDKHFIKMSLNDQMRLHYGFYFGMSTLDYNSRFYQDLEENPEFERASKYITFPREMLKADNVYADVSSLSPALNIGLNAKYRLYHNLDLRLSPGLILGKRNYLYNIPIYPYDNVDIDADPDNKDLRTIAMKSTYINVPLVVMYSGKRYHNFRPYMFLGGSFQYDLEKKSRDNLLLKVKPINGCVDFGLGMDTFFTDFLLTVEMRCSIGLNNIIDYSFSEEDNDVPMYSYPIESLKSNTFSLIFYFQ